MTTTLAAPTEAIAADQCVGMPGVGWRGYSAVLRLRGERPSPRITYLDGDLWLMSPSFSHERLKERLGLFVAEIVLGLRIPCVMAGQTTFRRRTKEAGVEGDLSYYLANAEAVRGKDQIDLRVDPPPDLAIEAVHTHGADEVLEVYRRLGVPEVWFCDRADLQILALRPEGDYAAAAASRAFPFLSSDEIAGWVCRALLTCDMEWGTELRRWIAEALPARRGEQP